MARVTVEDCTQRIGNLFDLVLVASKRARQLAHGREARLPWENDKPTVVALREIAADKIGRGILEEVEEAPEKDLFALPDEEIEINLREEDEDDEEGLEDGQAAGSKS